MNTYVVWMDSSQAKIYKVSEHPTKKVTLHHQEIKHHTAGDATNHKDPEKYFHTLAHDLHDAGEVVLMGPGLAKTHFVTHLEKHHHGDLNKKIVGVETVDHPTENQILALSRKFFKKYDQFHGA